MDERLLWAIVSGLGTAILTYLFAYIKAKAKFQAELESIAKRTEEQEKVIAKYKIEASQKEHQYQKRHDVYLKYLSLLDKFEAETPLLQKEQTGLWMSQLVNALYLYREDEANRMKAINHFGDLFDGMVNGAMAGLKDIAVQTNEIKLIATNEINDIFEKLKQSYQKVAEISSSVFSDPVAICSGTVNFDSVNSELKKLKEETVGDRKKLLSLMRQDLGVNS